jgi:hypothetical protein
VFRSYRAFWLGNLYDSRHGDAIVASLRSSDRTGALRLSSAGGFSGRMGQAFFEAVGEGVDVGIRLDEEYVDIRFELSQGRRVLRVLASLGSVSALLGSCWQFLWFMSGKHGLATLVPGMPLRLATERGALAAALGFSVTLVCLGAHRFLMSETTPLLKQLRRMSEALELIHGSKDQLRLKKAV